MQGSISDGLLQYTHLKLCESVRRSNPKNLITILQKTTKNVISKLQKNFIHTVKPPKMHRLLSRKDLQTNHCKHTSSNDMHKTIFSLHTLAGIGLILYFPFLNKSNYFTVFYIIPVKTMSHIFSKPSILSHKSKW